MKKGLSYLAALLLSTLVVAQDEPAAGDEQRDSSRLPAEKMPLADESLLLDLVAVNDRLVAVGERGHVLLSSDRETWRQAEFVPTRSNLTAVTAVGDELWAVGHDVVIIHSSDGGENWELQQADPSMMQPLLDVYFVDAERGFALGAYGHFLSTDDGGETWEEGLSMEKAEEEEEEPAAEETADIGDPTYDYSDYQDEFTDFHFNGMSRLEDGTLFIAAEAGNGLISRDGGESWLRFELPYEGSMFGTLVTPEGSLLAYGLRGHVLESSDGGETWTELETGTLNSLMGGTVTPDGTVVLVGANGEVLTRRAGSDQFQSQQTKAGEDLADAIPSGWDSIILVGEEGIDQFSLNQEGEQ